MIQETIVTTHNAKGKVHIAPMGIHILSDSYLIMPFRPSTTLDNILITQTAVINFCDDVRVFAGCLTGRRDWPTQRTEKISGYFLRETLSHLELEVLSIEEDETRPKILCKAKHAVNHAPFNGFNRAQSSVLELAILVSRLDMLPWEKISSEIEYLKIGLEKTAGERELQAWNWLMEKVHNVKQQRGSQQ